MERFGFRVHILKHHAAGERRGSSCSIFRVPGFGFRVQRFRVSDFKFSDSGFRISGSDVLEHHTAGERREMVGEVVLHELFL